jgi:hypothetical protein
LDKSRIIHSTDSAPLVTFIGPYTVSKSGSPLQVTLSSTDAESDPVTYTATVVSSSAYYLQQQYAFTAVGLAGTTLNGVTTYAYVFSTAGNNINGNVYYLLNAAGDLYAWDGGSQYSTTFANHNNYIASVGASVYTTPTLLTNAQATAVPATVSVSGNTLTVNVSNVAAGIAFDVFLTASDGAKSTGFVFTVSVTA